MLAILCISDYHSADPPTHKFLLVVTELNAVKKTHSDSFMPYPLLRYNKNFKYYSSCRTPIPDVHIIEPENIYRPAIIIPCPDRCDAFGQAYVARNRLRNPNKLNSTTDSIRLWGIPYKVVDRAGYDMTIPSLQENPLFIEDEQMNAIYDEEQNNNGQQVGQDENDYYGDI